MYFPIEYNNTRPRICLHDFDLFMNDTARQYKSEEADLRRDNIIKATYFTKPKCWIYENEIRFLHETTFRGTRHLKFPKTVLKEILMGANISDKDKKYIIKIKNKYFNHAKLIQLSMSNNKYSLKKEEVNS